MDTLSPFDQKHAQRELNSHVVDHAIYHLFRKRDIPHNPLSATTAKLQHTAPVEHMRAYPAILYDRHHHPLSMSFHFR